MKTIFSDRKFGLDFLRAAAAAMVVLAHGMMYAAASYPQLILPAVVLATLGVEVFFVLSGFLIAPGLFAVAEGKSTAVRFWLRRAWRTLPNYYIFLLINVALSTWIVYGRPPQLSYAIFSQSLVTPSTTTFFAESWSLAVEEWFYLGAAAAAALSFRISGERAVLFRWLLWGMVICLPVARAAWSVMHGYEWDSGLRKLTLLRLDAIAVGVLAAALARSPLSRVFAVRCAICGVALVGAASISVASVVRANEFLAPLASFSIALTGAFTLTLFGVGAALVLPFAARIQRPQSLPIFSTLVSRVALWSYTLYLCHFPLLLLFDEFFPGFRQRQPGSLALGMSLWLILVVLFASAFYAEIESRILAWRDRILPS